MRGGGKGRRGEERERERGEREREEGTRSHYSVLTAEVTFTVVGCQAMCGGPQGYIGCICDYRG